MEKPTRQIGEVRSRARSVVQGFAARRALNAKSFVDLNTALHRGANPNEVARIHPKGNYGKTTLLLHRAVELSWIAGVELLLQYGADPELRSGPYHSTALFMAADLRNPKMIATLVAAGACPQGMGWGFDYSKMEGMSYFSAMEYSHFDLKEMTVADLIKGHRDPEERRALLLGVVERSDIRAKPSSPAPKM